MIIGSIAAEYVMLFISIVYQVIVFYSNYKKNKAQELEDKMKGIIRKKEDYNWFIVY